MILKLIKEITSTGKENAIIVREIVFVWEITSVITSGKGKSQYWYGKTSIGKRNRQYW